MGDSCHLPQRATSLTGQVYDAVASFLLVTPLVLLFRHGTCTTLEQFVVSKYETRWTAALVLVTIGIVIEVCVTYWQILYKLTACKLGMEGHELPTSLQTAVLSLILLFGLQAVRNIVAIPIQLSLDLPMSSEDAVSVWFTIPTYYQTQPTMEVYSRLFDAMITQGIVRSLVILHWMSMRYVFVNILCNEYAMITSCVVGFLGVINFWLLQDKFKDWSKQYDDKSCDVNKKIMVEDLFIFCSMSCAILAWNGIDLLIEDVLYDRYKLRYGPHIVTGLAFNVFSFVALVAIKTSRSLLILGAEIDGSMKGGAGVQFETAYFDCGCDCPAPASNQDSKDGEADPQCISDKEQGNKSKDSETQDQASSAPRAPERSSKAAKK